tara:strand:+ start:599 stop:1060 length:462 start_codon:yes stop_codon:yes gene_type:complete
MKLIKENIEKKRKVYKLEDRYRKVWEGVNVEMQEEHIAILNEVMEGWVIDYGVTKDTTWIDYHIVPGTPANTFAHTPQFVQRIYDFCIDSIQQTSPYAHYDWVLSNIMIDGDNTYLVDWDNVGLYSPEQMMGKLESDLRSAFGDKFNAILQKD